MGDLSVRRLRRLEEHMKLFPGQCMKAGTYASKRFDQLYLSWIQARWDEGDRWVRDVWEKRPT